MPPAFASNTFEAHPNTNAACRQDLPGNNRIVAGHHKSAHQATRSIHQQFQAPRLYNVKILSKIEPKGVIFNPQPTTGEKKP